MLKNLLAACCLLAMNSYAFAQTGTTKTAAALNSEVFTFFPDQNSGQIIPFNTRQMLLDMIQSTTVFPGGFANITVNPYTPPVNFPGTQPFQINETVTGTCTTTNNNCYYNFIDIPSDNAVVGSGTSGIWESGIGFFENMVFGGAALTGQRIAAAFQNTMTAATGNTAVGASYGALAAYMNANSSDNGTGTSVSNSRGQIEAVNFVAFLGGAATNFRAVQGGEVNIAISAGGSAYEKVGWQITQLPSDAVQGSTFDTAIGISNQSGAVGWQNAILFGGLQGVWPFTTTATAITCASPCGTLATFIDMSGATISSNFLKSPGFTLSGTGTMNVGGHLAASLGTAPTIGTCATGSIVAGSSDVAGRVSMTSGQSTCSINFATTYAAAPFCTIAVNMNVTTLVGTSTTQLTGTFSAATPTIMNWICFGV